MKSKIVALSNNQDFKRLLNEKKIDMKFNYSYLVIAKPTMLDNEYTNIKETLFKEFKKI